MDSSTPAKQQPGRKRAPKTRKKFLITVPFLRVHCYDGVRIISTEIASRIDLPGMHDHVTDITLPDIPVRDFDCVHALVVDRHDAESLATDDGVALAYELDADVAAHHYEMRAAYVHKSSLDSIDKILRDAGACVHRTVPDVVIVDLYYIYNRLYNWEIHD